MREYLYYYKKAGDPVSNINFDTRLGDSYGQGRPETPPRDQRLQQLALNRMAWLQSPTRDTWNEVRGGKIPGYLSVDVPRTRWGRFSDAVGRGVHNTEAALRGRVRTPSPSQRITQNPGTYAQEPQKGFWGRVFQR